ncbi:DUF2723 domain-containing protein, partial [bacterium]|nr:DUF2723 domain-containing protein [bacterium]
KLLKPPNSFLTLPFSHKILRLLLCLSICQVLTKTDLPDIIWGVKKGKGFARWLPKDEPIRPEPFGKIDYLCGLLVLFVSFGVYLYTLTPTVGFHDSGDMITASWVLGLPHPTGYPLYTLLGKLFCIIIPIGNIAYRMNMESALFASLAVMMTYFITLKLISFQFAIRNSQFAIISSIVASLILAFSPTFWEQAVIAEKYTLNAFFFTLLIFILLKWQESIRDQRFAIRNLYLFSFLLGLSFCHHMETILVIPATIFFLSIFWKNKTKKFFLIYNSQFVIRNLLIMFLFPLTLYLYLPIRSATHPSVNWEDADRFNGFLNYITASGYTHYFEKSSLFSLLKKPYNHWGTHISQQFGILFWPAISGILVVLIRMRRIFYLFLLVILTNTLLCLHYNIPNIPDYYIPTYIILSVGFGILLNCFLSLSKNRVIFLLSPLLLFLPWLPFSENIKNSNKSLEYHYYDEGMAWLLGPKENAIILPRGDISFVFWYLCYVEGVRQDLFLIEPTFLHTQWLMEELKKKYPDLIFDKNLPKERVSPLVLHSIRFQKEREIMEKNLNRYSIYTSFDEKATKGFRLIPEGFFERVVDNNISNDKLVEMAKFSALDVDPYYRRSKGLSKNVKNYYKRLGCLFSDTGESEEAIKRFKKAKEIDPKDKEVVSVLSNAYYNLGVKFDQTGKLTDAEIYYKETIKVDPYMIDAHYNLGLLYYKQGESKKAILHWKKVLEIDPMKIKVRENLAVAYYNIKDYKSAYLECKKILQLNPENTNAKQMLEVTEQKISLLQQSENVLFSAK